MNFKDAQLDMRHAYLGGGPGVFTSGMVWLIAGMFAVTVSAQASVFALFIGGMFIHPLGTLFAKALKRTGKHKTGNPLAVLAIESTALLFIGLFIAFAIVQIRSGWFYPVMLLVIGGRYLLFSTIYGMRVYWALGGLLSVAGIACLLLNANFALGAVIGGSIELVASAIIIALAKRS